LGNIKNGRTSLKHPVKANRFDLVKSKHTWRLLPFCNGTHPSLDKANLFTAVRSLLWSHLLYNGQTWTVTCYENLW